jgi:hypothetical protein
MLLSFPLLPIEGEHQSDLWPAFKNRQVLAERYAPSDKRKYPSGL